MVRIQALGMRKLGKLGELPNGIIVQTTVGL